MVYYSSLTYLTVDLLDLSWNGLCLLHVVSHSLVGFSKFLLTTVSGKGQWKSTFKATVCITFANVSLLEDSTIAMLWFKEWRSKLKALSGRKCKILWLLFPPIYWSWLFVSLPLWIATDLLIYINYLYVIHISSLRFAYNNIFLLGYLTLLM